MSPKENGFLDISNCYRSSLEVKIDSCLRVNSFAHPASGEWASCYVPIAILPLRLKEIQLMKIWPLMPAPSPMLGAALHPDIKNKEQMRSPVSSMSTCFPVPFSLLTCLLCGLPSPDLQTACGLGLWSHYRAMTFCGSGPLTSWSTLFSTQNWTTFNSPFPTCSMSLGSEVSHCPWISLTATARLSGSGQFNTWDGRIWALIPEIMKYTSHRARDQVLQRGERVQWLLHHALPASYLVSQSILCFLLS